MASTCRVRCRPPRCFCCEHLKLRRRQDCYTSSGDARMERSLCCSTLASLDPFIAGYVILLIPLNIQCHSCIFFRLQNSYGGSLRPLLIQGYLATWLKPLRSQRKYTTVDPSGCKQGYSGSRPFVEDRNNSTGPTISSSQNWYGMCSGTRMRYSSSPLPYVSIAYS